MMMNDEVVALQGIFCEDGEFEMLANIDSEWRFCIHVKCQSQDQKLANSDQSQGTLEVSLLCHLPIGYPEEELPTISLACDSLTKHSANQAKDKLYEYANNLRGQPMIMELVYWVQENLRKFVAAPLQTRSIPNEQEDGNKPYTAVLQIDHMRCRAKYTKLILNWASELSLSGRILFLQHLILILIIGAEGMVKDFLVRLRTQKVDVDSSGRSCKERMMTVLMQFCRPQPSENKRMSDFRLLECSTVSEIQDVFSEADLIDIFQETVVPKFPLLRTPGSKHIAEKADNKKNLSGINA